MAKKELSEDILKYLLKKEAHLSWLLIISTAAIMIFIIPLGVVSSWEFIIVFLAAMVLLNILFTYLVKREELLSTIRWFWPFTEVLIITLVIYYTGGFASVFSFLYLFPIVISALLFSMEIGLFIAAFSSLAYTALTVLEFNNLIPHVSGFGIGVLQSYDSVYVAFSILLNRVLIFFLVALLGGYLAQKQREVDEARIEFVYLASHQLRTPTTSIRLFAELLHNEIGNKLNDKQKGYLDNIAHLSKRMGKIVNDFLIISRFESGRIKVEPEIVQLEDIIQDIVKELSPLAKEKQCHIKFEKPEHGTKKVFVDPSLSHHMIHNLVHNAVSYTIKRKRSIIITLEDYTKKKYLVSIKDQGIGIPEKQKDKIFSRFFRTDNAVKQGIQGSGMGLYIVKMIADAMNEKVWFESELGAGSTFYLTVSKKHKRARRKIKKERK